MSMTSDRTAVKVHKDFKGLRGLAFLVAWDLGPASVIEDDQGDRFGIDLINIADLEMPIY